MSFVPWSMTTTPKRRVISLSLSLSLSLQTICTPTYIFTNLKRQIFDNWMIARLAAHHDITHLKMMNCRREQRVLHKKQGINLSGRLINNRLFFVCYLVSMRSTSAVLSLYILQCRIEAHIATIMVSFKRCLAGNLSYPRVQTDRSASPISNQCERIAQSRLRTRWHYDNQGSHQPPRTRRTQSTPWTQWWKVWIRSSRS